MPSLYRHPTPVDDRTKLMVIDQLLDTMDDRIADDLRDGLCRAFERAEEGCSGTFVPLHPGKSVDLTTWKLWRERRDAYLAGVMAGQRRAA